MTRAQARTILRGMFHDALDPRTLTPKAKQEMRDAVDAVLDAVHPPIGR